MRVATGLDGDDSVLDPNVSGDWTTWISQVPYRSMPAGQCGRRQAGEEEWNGLLDAFPQEPTMNGSSNEMRYAETVAIARIMSNDSHQYAIERRKSLALKNSNLGQPQRGDQPN